MIKMKKYKEFIIKTSPFNTEILSGLMWELNISGLEEEESFIKIFSADDSLSKNGINIFLKKLIGEKIINEFSVEELEIENKNWNEEWEKNLQVIKVTDRIVIKPSSKSYIPNKKEIILTIDPKMSFGTGEHQTTKLMLRLIEKCVRPGMKVLDIGSGTAVLAIAAVKLGAANAIAIDNDEICFENGNENISLNNVEDKVEIKIGELKEIKENNFDLIVANIQKNILLNISYDIGNRLNKNGLVILSGLLAEDEEDILSRYKETGLYFIEKEKMDEWIAIVFALK